MSGFDDLTETVKELRDVLYQWDLSPLDPDDPEVTSLDTLLATVIVRQNKQMQFLQVMREMVVAAYDCLAILDEDKVNKPLPVRRRTPRTDLRRRA